ncbi:zinc finger E-box-binding homeobox 1-like isoform X3 [Hippocampus zosterae]|uniref:zinc finger E-box-binding homeobox 1-like isoform X3 n=1 Tax=Hippocampus zosterae TaxID=109293 RepID=UPI00223CB454|nr:zinc finger E-box-binding homeobox 1-like isoform X3 [Hippocampus zosterae]
MLQTRSEAIMADGPRCKRRKQANPKRSSVTNLNGGLEASSSDSDDDDKLHIVEDESPPDADAFAVARRGRRHPKDATDTNNAVLAHNGAWNGVKQEEEEEEDCVSGDEDEDGKVEAQVVVKKEVEEEEILEKEGTAVLSPQAPDDEQSPMETGGADENGTPDTLQLHTCPYCSRGYKRNASLKEHIKYRHETSEDNYRCSHCSYTFTYRSQLERHMSHHRGNKEQRHVQPSGGGGSGGGARKFKCTECFKAFKYKHHLKEHLRIHSGEKPYECSNCKKRFSHSGSYSSHISSKKCVSAACAPNGLARKPVKSPQPISANPRVAITSARVESKPLQEQLPLTQIKSEVTEPPSKPAILAAPAANGAAPQLQQPLSQGVAMVLPTMGLVPPININLSELQNVLKVALDGNVLRQVLGTANGAAVQGKSGIVVQQPQQQIISLPAFVDHDGTTKIIINYSIGPAPATAATTVTSAQPMPLFVKNNIVPAAPIPTKTDKPPTSKVDLSLVKDEPEESVPITETKTDQVMTVKKEEGEVPPPNSESSTCSLCDECPEHLEALHLLQHQKAANGEAVDSAALDPSFAALLSDAGVTLQQEPAVDDLLTLLKTYFASNANPNQAELEKISDSVSIPVGVVRKWFAKMNSGTKSCQDRTAAKQTESLNCKSEDTKQAASRSQSDSPSLNASDLVIVKSEPEDPEAQESQAEPLDLSLPKHLTTPITAAPSEDAPPAKKTSQALNLTCLRKEQVGGRTVYVATPQTRRTAVSIVPSSQLPTLVAITGQGTVGCLGTLGGSAKRTILIPQLTYTYANTAGGAAKTVVLNGHKTPAPSTDTVPNEQKETLVMKKPRLENGVYACDLCNKVFQKGSSLLRHKYEHTGKRPHECPVCKKAFKHKHHLIEHSRLHSGEKPYQCNKCGKRFSHSGSYSQHMNHRYSYCKRDGSDSGSSPDGDANAIVVADLDATLDSEVGESEEDDEAMCVDDIRVVQVDDGECEIYEGNFDDDDEEDDDDDVEDEEHDEKKEKNLDVDEFACQVVEVELKHDQTQESAIEQKVDKAEAAGVHLEQMADCAYKSIRDWSDSEESSDDQAVTDTK